MEIQRIIDDVDVNNPNTFNGGDFAGITKKLDYLKEMGIYNDYSFSYFCK